MRLVPSTASLAEAAAALSLPVRQAIYDTANIIIEARNRINYDHQSDIGTDWRGKLAREVVTTIIEGLAQGVSTEAANELADYVVRQKKAAAVRHARAIIFSTRPTA